MRKIHSKKDEAKKRKKNQLILVFILVFLMFFSIVGYAFQLIINQNTESSSGQTNPKIVTYNGYEFKEQNGFWVLNKDDTNFIFKNNPYEVPRINSHINPLENYVEKDIYISSESIEAESEIRTNLAQIVGSIKNACQEGETCNGVNLTKSCKDNFLIIRESSDGKTKIEQSDNCVYIEGSKDSLTKITDEFIFKILKVDNYL